MQDKNGKQIKLTKKVVIEGVVRNTFTNEPNNRNVEIECDGYTIFVKPTDCAVK